MPASRSPRRDVGHIAITGASAGIGAGLAQAFGTDGNRLTLVARREALLDEVAASVACPTFVAPRDLSDPEASVSWIDEAEAAHGPIDVLICNAGIQFVGDGLRVDDALTARTLQVNVQSPIRQASQVLPAMKARGRGTVVVVASVAALIHTPWMALYNASKAAVAAWFETMRVELEGTGVNVVTVYPGPVSTELERAARDKLASPATRHMPTGTPEALGAMVRKAVRRGDARLIYPRSYAVSRHARVASQWLTNRLTPRPQ